MNATATPPHAGAAQLEHAGYRWAYLVVSFGLLVSVAYRSVVRRESSWDLLSLVLLGGIVLTVARVREGAPFARSARSVLVAVLLALAVDAALALLAR
ncbi:MAG: hypothetical protein ACXW0Z_02425 [Gemmatirosa sp.]